MSTLKFESYYKENIDALSSFALKLTKNRMDAEDLLQETAIKAYKNFTSFKDGSSFKNWTFTILKNTFITKYRKKRKLNIVTLPVEEMEFAIAPQEKKDKAPEKVLRLVSKHIDSLSKRSKEPFGMYLNGYQYSEISENLDIPLGTVKSRIHFARTKLRKLLKAC